MTQAPVASFQGLLACARTMNTPRMAVAAAGESAVIAGVADAVKEGLIVPVLIGAGRVIRDIADRHGFDLANTEVIDVPDASEASAKAVRLVYEGRAELVMKGLVTTKEFVRAILNQDFGIRRRRPMSHVAVLESPDQSRLMLLTDSGINIRPRFNRKVAIVRNAILVANALGIAVPKVAVIAAVEKVELPAMPATLDAELLRRMGESGRLGPCIVDGPLAMDNALESHTAEIKGRTSPVTGNADIIVMPDIETGNAVYKTIRYMARREIGGVIVGGAAPAVVTSRSDSAACKLYSIALGVLVAHQERLSEQAVL